MDAIRKHFTRIASRVGFQSQDVRGSKRKFRRSREGFQNELSIDLQDFPIANQRNDIREMSILNCKNLPTAIEFFESPSVKSELQSKDSILFIQFQVEEDFGELTSAHLSNLIQISQDKAVVIYIRSTNDDNFLVYWKSKDFQHFLMFKAYDETSLSDEKKICGFIANFVADSLSRGELGIIKDLTITPEANKIELHSLADDRGYNILLIAAESGKADVVQILLEMGISSESSDDSVKAQDLAWNNNHSDVILTLLNANLPFPCGIDPELCSNDLKKFIRTNEEMHSAILYRYKEKIEDIRVQNPNQRYFYNIDNVSAAKAAIMNKSLEVYELLITHKVFFAHHEDEEEFWDELEEHERKLVREIHFRHLKDLPEKHINILMAHSFVGHDVQNAPEKREHVLKAYKFLNSNPLLSVLLMVVVACKKLRSVFDFNRDSVYFTDPTTDSTTNGMFYLSGRVYVGAKQLLDQTTHYETYAVIAHEFCHYAINLTYGNNAKPYCRNDNQTMQEFEKISEKCQQRRNVERIIDIVYDSYPPDMHHAELIVRVPHLIVLYHDQPERLKKVRGVFIELFEFYEKKIVPEMMSSLPEIERRDEKEIEKKDRKISNLKSIIFWSAILSALAIIFAIILGRMISQKPNYMYSELSMDQILKVQHSIVSYKNVLLKFEDLFPENSTAYNKLTSDHMMQMFDDKPLDLSDPYLNYLNGYIHHDWSTMAASLKLKFLQSNFTFQNESLKFEKLIDICPEVFNSLTSSEIIDGLDGKTITVGRMIPNNTEFFIERHFIFENSGDCIDFENYSNTKDGFEDTIERTKRTRMFILSSEAGAGKTVTFKQLTMRIKKRFPTRWVSYIDLKEHSKKYNSSGNLTDINKLMTELFDLNSKTEFEKAIFKESFKSGNVVLLWNGFDEISPTYNKFIENVLSYIHQNTTNIQYVSTRPLYSKQLQEKFHLKAYQLVPFNKDEQIEFLTKLFKSQNITQENLDDNIRNITLNLNFNTPLMLKLIAEIFEADSELVKSQNHYYIFEKLVQHKVTVWQNKGDHAQNITNKLLSGSNFEIIKLYQKYALQNELEYLNIRKLKIMDMKIPKSLNFEEITRIGILFINNENDFSFAHKTFADFFHAKYFIENIYDFKDDLNVEEAELRLQTFFYAFKSYSDMRTVAKFMGDYIDAQESNGNQSFHPVISQLLKTKFKKFFFEFLDHKDPEIFACMFKFFKKDYDVFVDMLQVNEDETLCTATYSTFYRPKYVQYSDIKKFVRNELKDKDFQKFISGRNQKGIILFGMTFYNHLKFPKSHDEYDIGTEKIADDYLFSFMDKVKDNLTEPEQKELFIYLTSPRIYKSFNTFTITYYESLWTNYGHLVSTEETKSIIGSAIYWYLRFYYYAKYPEYENILPVLINKSKEIMTDVEINDMFIRENILHRAAFHKRTFEQIWQFFVEHSTNEQQVHMLLRSDTSGHFFYYNNEKIISYLFDSSHFNAFHLSLIYAERDRRFFNSVKENYTSILNQTEMQNMILSSNDFMLYVAYYGNEYTCKEFALYLETLFDGNKEALREFLERNIKPTNWNIFEYFTGFRIDLSGVLNVFAKLLGRIKDVN
ncbi:uncharacterized protein [Chironomus tepperi]|uniref:uncharacterized protein n=1 Tax=Chironomus tepperi TaxID=113505 RepID=UPI00391F4C94